MNLPNQVAFDILGIDSLSWTNFTAQYLATGGEQYIYVGSNTPNDQLDCIEVFNEESNFWNAAYIMVDNVSVAITEECSVRIADSSETPTGYRIYPNPVSNNLFITGFSHGNVNGRLYDTQGRFLFDQEFDMNGLNLEWLESGCYIFEIRNDESVEQVRFVKE
ncbi:MAG: T9SS type A sorting domain-containing protein [Flavobacteriales bacterium]|nr:T9SS type A sorting domain-containing protein [Flavobacteriales bacterium]